MANRYVCPLSSLVNPKYRQLILTLLGVTVGGGAFIFYTSWGCSLIGGKWGAGAGSCFTPLCYDFKNCGEWSAPSRWCSSLHVRDTERKLYFKLGMPNEIVGNKRSWHAGKASSKVIVATVENGVITELDCSVERGQT